MSAAIEAFRLVGVVEARTRGAEANLHRVDRVAATTARNMRNSLGSAVASTEGGFLRAGRAVDNFLQRFSNISNIIQGIPQIGQLAGALTRPLFQAAEEGVRLNMVLEQATIGYTQVAGSQEKASKFLTDLQRFGQRSPFRFEGLLQASRLMTAFGFDLDEQIPKLTVWGNAIAASGELSADKIHAVVTAFGQMRMAGRVNAQDMMQLTNANLPGWELLAKAIGKTVAETRKLSEAGRLDGKKAVEAITAMMEIDPRYKDMMARLEKTTAGRLSAAEDILQFAQAKATRSLTGDISKTLEAALTRGDLVDNLAGKIDSSIKPISGALTASITAMLTGDADGLKNVAKEVLGSALSNGLTDGISNGVSTVKDAIGSLVQDGVVNPFKNLLGIKSPSQVFHKFGELCAEGFNDGFEQGLGNGRFQSIVDRFLGQLEGQMTARQKRAAENLAKLMEREPGFKDKLIAGARARNINPDHLLNVIAVETAGSFNPAAKNPHSTATGLIQFMKATMDGERGRPGLMTGTGFKHADLARMSAVQQLDWVFKYFDDFIKRGHDLSTQGALYAAVGAGKVGKSDNSVVMRAGDRGYAGNAPTWDRNMDGFIRQGEMAMAAVSKLGAGVNFTINGSPVTASNPVPVVMVAGGYLPQPAAGGRIPATATPAAPTAPKTTAPPKVIVGELTPAEMNKVQAMFNHLRNIRDLHRDLQPLSTTTNVMATSVMPRATQALEQMADNTERMVKGAGEWADVIVQSEEATRRLKVQWASLAGAFENALMSAGHQAISGNFRGAISALFGGLAMDVAQQFNAAFTARLSKALFDFDGETATGGLVSKALNKIPGFNRVLEFAGLQEKKLPAASSQMASASAQEVVNQALQKMADMNRQIMPGRARRVNGSTQTSNMSSNAPRTTTSASAGAGSPDVVNAVNQAADKITAAENNQTTVLSQQMRANAEYTVQALTPARQGFWSGLLGAALTGAVSGAAGAAVGGLFDGGTQTPEPGGSGQPRTGPPVLRPANPSNRTRPREVFPNQRRAWGGPVIAGQEYLIGENGPEKFRPWASGTVIPNHKLNENNGQRPVIYAPLIVHTPDAATFNKSAGQLEKAWQQRVIHASRLN